MDISWIIAIGIVGLIIASLVLPWTHRGQIQDLQREIQKLKAQLRQSQTKTEVKVQEDIVQPAGMASQKITVFDRVSDQIRSQLPPQIPAKISNQVSAQIPAQPSSQAPNPIPNPISPSKKSKISFEQQFGARLPVWVGGIAMALAGFFLVKYSIEAGLLTEKVRVIMGLLFGLVLLYVGSWVRRKPAFANGVRIAQALTGAGIADLYACSFAATNLYHLVPVYMGFVGMAIITCAAIYLSLRHGPPIALMGLFGGLLTPILINSNTHNTPVLFAYLYLVIAGLLVLIRQKNWWALFFPAVIGAFLWVIFWISSSGFISSDSLWLNLFLIAISITFVCCSTRDIEEKFPSSKSLNILTLCGTVFLIAIISFKTSFDLQTWSLFGLLAAGGIVLAYFNQKLYGFLPWVLMIVNAVMLFTWSGASVNAMTIGIMIIIFAALYSISACCFLWRSQNPLQWAGLAGTCSIVYYLIGYSQLHHQFPSLFLWGSIAIGLSLLAIVMVGKVLEASQSVFDQELKQKLLTIFTLTATTFLSLGLAIIVKQKLLPIAFATQIFVMSWINAKVDIKSLRTIIILLMGVFIFLLLPQISFFLQLLINSLLVFNSGLAVDYSTIHSPVLQLGLPAILFGASSVLLRKQIDDKLVRFLEYVGIILLGLMLYCLERYIYHGQGREFLSRASFTERGVITDIILSYGLVCIWLGRQFLRSTILFSGLILIGMALLRITYFDLVFFNPLWSREFIGNIILFNALILPYGLPIAGIFLANKILYKSAISKDMNIINIKQYLNSINFFALILLFVFLSLNIRQFYQGAYLNGNITTDAEIYTYSVVWLLMGIGLLVTGTLNHNKTIRVASLLIMILTAGKVFLYDASTLTGLYRVFSFFGLGLSLMALSWFYTRFVFKKS